LVRTNYPTKRLPNPTGSEVIVVKFSPDGKILAAGTHEGGVIFWNYTDASKLADRKGHTNESR
jgi:WD40 repeat protein